MKFNNFLWSTLCLIVLGGMTTISPKETRAIPQGEERAYAEGIVTEKPRSDTIVPGKITGNDLCLTLYKEVFIAEMGIGSFSRIESRLIEEVAQGHYDKAIEEGEDYLKRISIEWWNMPANDRDYDNDERPYLISAYQRFLAVTYELKGDWQRAMVAYIMAYGDQGEEIRWAKIRKDYAMKIRKHYAGEIEMSKVHALRRLVDEIRREYLGSVVSVDSVNEKLQKNCEVAEPDWKSPFVYYIHDPEWKSLWKFRYNCARVICPELGLVLTSEDPHNTDMRDFFELQQESYEKFVEFVEEYWGEKQGSRFVISSGSSENLKFLRELKTMPYKIKPKQRNKTR